MIKALNVIFNQTLTHRFPIQDRLTEAVYIIKWSKNPVTEPLPHEDDLRNAFVRQFHFLLNSDGTDPTYKLKLKLDDKPELPTAIKDFYWQMIRAFYEEQKKQTNLNPAAKYQFLLPSESIAAPIADLTVKLNNGLGSEAATPVVLSRSVRMTIDIYRNIFGCTVDVPGNLRKR